MWGCDVIILACFSPLCVSHYPICHYFLVVIYIILHFLCINPLIYSLFFWSNVFFIIIWTPTLSGIHLLGTIGSVTIYAWSQKMWDWVKLKDLSFYYSIVLARKMFKSNKKACLPKMYIYYLGYSRQIMVLDRIIKV